MMNCVICNGKGYLFDPEKGGKPCRCHQNHRWAEYLKPMMFLTHSLAKGEIKYPKLENRNQVVTSTADNIAALMKYMLSGWFPEKYVVTSMEEVNAIFFEKHSAYKSIYEFTNEYRYFIVDMTFINSIRAKSAGWNTNDSMCMLDLVKAILPSPQRIVILVKPGITGFVKQYPELCRGLNDFGIEYFHAGTYKKFPIDSNSNCAGGDSE